MKTKLFLAMVLASVMSLGAFAQTGTEVKEVKKEEKIVKAKAKKNKKLEHKLEKKEEKKEEIKK